MSYKDIIDQKKREKEDNPIPINEDEFKEHYNSEYFGVENIRNLPACLDLRLSDGNCEAIPYSLITKIKYNTQEGISLITYNTEIKIKGRSLQQLYNYLLLFRIRYIQMHQGLDAGGDELCVTEIDLREQ